jgi:SAM-dependent methyltransferase
MADQSDHLEMNRRMWDHVAPIHAASEFYDVEGFIGGKGSLRATPLAEVGDVVGKRLLHLQCHFGLDTLSWARLGAEVTGVDFSGAAIAQARELADKTGLEATFVQSTIDELPQHLRGEFDIAFTSEGVLAWLPDLTRWAHTISHFLRPGGIFYIWEFHPVLDIFDDADGVRVPIPRYPYFGNGEPLVFDGGQGSYADGDADVPHGSSQWFHSIGEILNALIGAGLRIEFLHEFDTCTYQARPFLVQGDDGLWRYEDGPGTLPLMFSVRASKA